MYFVKTGSSLLIGFTLVVAPPVQELSGIVVVPPA